MTWIKAYNEAKEGGQNMLSENLKNLRKAKGLSQEELAVKLNVVRQTISKWEKGLSVPDSEMLIRIAEELGVSVTMLLGEQIEEKEQSELKEIAAKLEILNEQFAKRNDNRRKLWRAVFILLGLFVLFNIGYDVIIQIAIRQLMHISDAEATSVAIIGGADGPTSIFIASRVGFSTVKFIIMVLLGIVSFAGIYKTRRK